MDTFEKKLKENESINVTEEFFKFEVLGSLENYHKFSRYLTRERPENDFIIKINWGIHKDDCTGRLAFFKAFQQNFLSDSRGLKHIKFIFMGTETDKIELMKKDENAANAFASGVKWEII